FTPDSTLPLVWARYGWHSRGVKPQCPAKEANVGFSLGLPPLVPSTTVRMRSKSKNSQRPPMGECSLVRGQQVRHALAQEAQREASPAVAQRHHEDVDLTA